MCGGDDEPNFSSVFRVVVPEGDGRLPVDKQLLQLSFTAGRCYLPLSGSIDREQIEFHRYCC